MEFFLRFRWEAAHGLEQLTALGDMSFHDLGQFKKSAPLVFAERCFRLTRDQSLYDLEPQAMFGVKPRHLPFPEKRLERWIEVLLFESDMSAGFLVEPLGDSLSRYRVVRAKALGEFMKARTQEGVVLLEGLDEFSTGLFHG
jgi:hypothetical protein